MAIHHIVRVDTGRGGVLIVDSIERCPLLFRETISARSRGREAVIVYSIRYRPACSRSGWYPQPIIRSRVGINEASNKM